MLARARRIAEGALTAPELGSETDVIRRARAGDVGAFEELYRAHFAAISALARRMSWDAEEAREMVQDIFVRAWEQLGSFEGRSAFGSWLHRLGVNVILNRIEASKRRAAHLSHDPDDDVDSFAARGAAIDERIDLEAALKRIPAGARAVFVLHDMQGYSHEEIATLTGTAVGTARAQLWRARRHLMRLLDR